MEIPRMNDATEDQDLCLYTDGASRGNPGPAGAGVVVVSRNGRTIAEKSVFLGKATNNMAEYQALVIGLRELGRFLPKRLTIRMDSELIVKQLNGAYRVRNKDLLPMYLEAKDLIGKFGIHVEVVHVPREQNQHADRLANLAIDSH